jgi:predicted transcriptional regulator
MLKIEILTAEKTEGINVIKCSTSVKYLGVRVAVEKKDQIRISKEQINKNVQLLRWKLKRVDGDVLERLTCCLPRSMLIYIGTPMAAAGLW